MIISIFTSSPIFYSLIILGLLIMLLLSDVSLSAMAKNGKPFVFLVGITALYHLLFSARDTKTLFEIMGFRLTEGGVEMALSFSLRVLVFVALAFFISLTTSPSDIAETLVNWLKPLKRIGAPVNDIGLIVFIAMRFIPVLAEEFETIRKAQVVRGVNFSGGIKNRARKMTILLIPVFQSAIRRADDLALAIESRGYISNAERSSLRVFRFGVQDWLFVLLAMVITTILFVLTGEMNWLK
jgi:energy-coupling factor transport system permease protein